MNARNVTAVARPFQCVAAVVTAALLSLSPAAMAQQPKSNAFVPKYTGTLKKIYDTKTIKVGHRENSPPFAFLDAKKQPIGYSLDLCEIVVEEVKNELGGEIKVEFVPVTPENRFDLVKSGAVDLECGSTTNNAERRKTVAFSPTMFVTGTKLMVRRGSGIFNLSDLAGKTVVLTKGTVHETAVPKIAERRKIPVKFVFAPDHKQSFETLAAGKADAFANDDVQLYGMLAETKSTADYRVVGDFLTYADYALMYRIDDPEFAEVVERAFHRLSGSREIVAIYDRWFRNPLPSGVRLNLPMSPHLETLFQAHGLPVSD
jgi:glutamate/aspartate transport system substrate-binding protein